MTYEKAELTVSDPFELGGTVLALTFAPRLQPSVSRSGRMFTAEETTARLSASIASVEIWPRHLGNWDELTLGSSVNGQLTLSDGSILKFIGTLTRSM